MGTDFLRAFDARAFAAWGVLLLALGSWTACNASSSADASGQVSGSPTASGGTGNPDIGIGNGTSVGGSTPLPPEKELDQTFRAPVATGRVLWSSNPDSGRVALIDAKTLKVRMTNAGFGPTYLAAVPSTAGVDAAIVLNVGSHDASFMQATSEQISVTTIATHTGANSWSISDDGHFAIAWTDARQVTAPDPSDGFSELTVIDLTATPPASTRLSVGFRPSQVVFDAQKLHAYAVVDEGISVLDLGAEPLVSSLISLTVNGGSARDVNIAHDGSFAVVRVDGSTDVEIVDLKSGTKNAVQLESDATDLDVSADDKTATAVLGNETPPKVVRFAVPNPGSSLVSFPIAGELVRSVTLSPDNQVALLYANAVPSNDLTLFDLTTDPNFKFRTVDLKGAVQRVYVSPDSQTAIAFQLPPSGSNKKGLFSIVPMSTELRLSPKIVATDAVPQDVAFSDPAAGTALVTVHDSSSTVYGVYVVELANLEQNFVALASEPLPGAAGIVPDVRVGFVAQKHPEGRITFIDLDSRVTQTLTGFEIAARVVQ
ncbi:MAG TPA: hypothetical protein VNW92_12120 [Polyangiaceae bacterium]|jgi:hypothetical protein|nr:hypothetical protein [Polyangiaceae bacterium]